MSLDEAEFGVELGLEENVFLESPFSCTRIGLDVQWLRVESGFCWPNEKQEVDE